MYHPLPTPFEMATWDRQTIETIGIPGLTLMESASREAVDVLLDEYGPIDGEDISCFAGSGNNGGDAFAMARQLSDLGAKVTVYHTRPKQDYRGESRTNLRWCQKLDIPLLHINSIDLMAISTPDIIIDGLLGTGFEGELRQQALDIIRTINRLGEHAFVLSVDIPSGLNGLTGQPQPEAVNADATATFQAAKLGLAMPGADSHAGTIHVRNIGIPKKITEEYPVRHHLISEEIMDRIPFPTRDMHKGKAGHVLVVGGSEGLTGAPHLAALAALRSGAGLATVACPGDLSESIKGHRPDIMTLPLDNGVEWTPAMARTIHQIMERFDAAIVGPGLGRSSKTVEFMRAFLEKCPPNMLLDADGLYCLAQVPELMDRLPSSSVLTPHPGEMATLSNRSTARIQQDRLAASEEFTGLYPGTLILKGAGTIVANRSIVCLSPFSEPNLSIGGAGDVLSGVIGSLMARGIETHTAACLGVYWHGATGRLLENDFPLRGNLATEIAESLPLTAKEYLSC